MPSRIIFLLFCALIWQAFASPSSPLNPSDDLPGEKVVFVPNQPISDVVKVPIVLPPFPRVFIPFPNVGSEYWSSASVSAVNPPQSIDVKSYNSCKYNTMQALKQPEKFPNYFLRFHQNPTTKLIPVTTFMDWFLEALAKSFSYKRNIAFEDFWRVIKNCPDFASLTQHQIVDFFVKMTQKGIIFMPAVRSFLALHPGGLLQQHQFDLYLALRYFAAYVKTDIESFRREFNSFLDCLVLLMKLYPEPVLTNKLLQFVSYADPAFHHPFSLVLKLAPLIPLFWGYESDLDAIDKYCEDAFHFMDGSEFRIMSMPHLFGLNQFLEQAFESLSPKPFKHSEVFFATMNKLVYNFFNSSVFAYSVDFMLSHHFIFILDALLLVESDISEDAPISFVEYAKIVVKYPGVRFLAISNFAGYYHVSFEEVRAAKSELLASGWSEDKFAVLEAFIAAIKEIPIHSAWMVTFEPTSEFLECIKRIEIPTSMLHLEIGRVYLTRQQVQPFSSFRILASTEETTWIDMIQYVNFFLERVTSDIVYDAVVLDDSHQNKPFQSGKASLTQIRSRYAEAHYHEGTFYSGQAIPSMILGIEDWICSKV